MQKYRLSKFAHLLNIQLSQYRVWVFIECAFCEE